ncbi:MAG: winged helix-turn-helix domain-containing protein, partial [Streptomycetales bacterium]
MTHAPASVVTLTADQARRAALRAQGLLGAPPRRDGTADMLRRLGAVQLDTISVLARSHELVAYARLGAVGRDTVEGAYWRRPPATFEYWSHAACLLPIEEWPHFAFRRRDHRRRGRRWHRVSERACAEVRARLRAEGALTASQLGGAKNGGPWWDWSDVKIAVEWLLDIGDVVCTERRGWKRVYDLAERAVPAPLLDDQPSDEECLRRLVHQAGRALGVATRADLADYHRLKAEQIDRTVGETGLVPVQVDGWRGPVWADPEALAALDRRGRHRTVLLSPFDSLVWDRSRTARVFGFRHRLEAYVPRHRREHGYYAMPLLAGGRLVGRADPAREGRTLVARQVSLETARAVAPMAAALGEAASWVGCDAVRVERVLPERLAAPLRAALA